MSTKSKAPIKVEPERLSVDASPDGLIEITIQLRKRKLVVHEATYLDGIQRGVLVGEVMKTLEDAKSGSPEAVKNNLITNLWAPLKACSTGRVPSKEEFLKMPEDDIAFWIETARELNPTWFVWLDAVENMTTEALKETTKKKEEKPTESSKS